MRKSGILLPVFSLPSEYGCGDLGTEAYRFIDRLSEAGQRYWQVLPIGPVNKELCPYQSSSGFAGEALLISLDILAEENLLPAEECEAVRNGAGSEEAADADSLQQTRLLLKRRALRDAHDAFRDRMRKEEELKLYYKAFCKMEGSWLDDYALYEALKDHYEEGDWSLWEEDIKRRDREAVAVWSLKLADETEYYKWTQFEFFRQWDALKKYAHERGVELIGDIPYYAAYESADCWACPKLFQLDSNGSCAFEAGAPPDAFTAKGQSWGNPVYDWNAHREQGFDWWIRRIQQQLRFFDVVRLDHMRGFESFFAIPADTEDPADGHWEKGPGMELFDAVRAALGESRFIAEDLGYLTPEVKEMMEQTGYPGMKILQFAFDTGEENVYLPFNYDTDNSVIYTGTHDNDTTLGWYEHTEDWKQRFVSWYLREKSDITPGRKAELFGWRTGEAGSDGDTGGAADAIMPAEMAVAGLIELAHSSRCGTCIIPMQDYLLLGSEARLNVPGVAKGNWRWQMDADAFTPQLVKEIAEMTKRYGR